MKLRWKNFKRIDLCKIKKWLKINPVITKFANSPIFHDYKYFIKKDTKYILGKNLFLKKVYHKRRLVGIIFIYCDDRNITINPIIVNPKYAHNGYGKAIISDFINNHFAITNQLANKITIGVTSDNYIALRLFKSLNFKLDNIHPNQDYYDYVFYLEN